MCENKPEFPGGRGVQNKKNLSWGRCGYFLELHNVEKSLFSKVQM